MQQSIAHIRSELQGIYASEEIEQFIAIIFRHLCNYSRAELIIYKNSKLSESLASEIRRFTSRLKAHEPIQYILGRTYFLDFEFIVRPGVLIPRPETEELIELICTNRHESGLRILDIGTGSGCIAISLAKLIPQANVSAWDISPDALKIAAENAQANQANIQFSLTDILTFNPEIYSDRFDIIVSNPPYVCLSEKMEMAKNVLDYEPHLALFVEDTDPLLFYRTIAQAALTLLNKGGELYFEINARFGSETREMLKSLGYQQVMVICDIHGKERITKAIRP